MEKSLRMPVLSQNLNPLDNIRKQMSSYRLNLRTKSKKLRFVICEWSHRKMDVSNGHFLWARALHWQTHGQFVPNLLQSIHKNTKSKNWINKYTKKINFPRNEPKANEKKNYIHNLKVLGISNDFTGNYRFSLHCSNLLCST